MEVDIRGDIPYLEPTFDFSEIPEGLTLNMGRSESARWKPFEVRLLPIQGSPSGLADYIFSVPFKIVSARFVKILRSFACDCEYLPLRVRYAEANLFDEYFALNSLRLVRHAIDRDKSAIGFYDEEFGTAEDVSLLTFRPDALEDAPLLFLTEIGRFAARDDLANAIDAAGLIGVRLVNPRQFNN